MENKIDSDLFDNEVAGLREMIGSIEIDDHKKPKVIVPVSSNNQSSFNSKEIGQIKELL